MPRYIVTPEAGPKVAGRAAAAGAVLDLTEFEARAELVAGALVPAQEPAETRMFPGSDFDDGSRQQPAPEAAPAGDTTDTATGRKRR